MEITLSVLAARILALTYLAAGIAAFRGRMKFREMIEDFERSPALTFVSGFFTLLVGMLLRSYHNLWVKDWRVLITVVAWMSVFKGLMLMAFPGYLLFFKNWYNNTRAFGVAMILIGLLFGYFGFV